MPALGQSGEWDIEDVYLMTKEKTYVVGVVEELFEILSVCMFANQFNESATCRARCHTSIGKGGICLLGVDERSTQGLKRMRRGYPEALPEWLPYETPRWLGQPHRRGSHGQRATERVKMRVEPARDEVHLGEHWKHIVRNGGNE